MIKLNEKILSSVINKRPQNSYKGMFGRVVIIGGNINFAGAIIMATSAAVYSGAGLVTTMTSKANKVALNQSIPEAMYVNYKKINNNINLIKTADVVLIGPGLGTSQTSKNILQQVFNIIGKKQVLIIDGSAITLIANDNLQLPKANIVFTPHQMEWQRLSGLDIKDQNYLNNKVKQAELKSTIVLKSHRTEIYTNNNCFQNTVGTPAQATGGMGDTLAGMIAGFSAQFNQLDLAVAAAVYLHSKIAEELAKERYVVLPHQIIQKIPYYMKKYEKK
ncbi:NAD(P)H-hydrate dehydratase [Apilactobacillus xinyiensis]|uniref:ADP-dependent (S)-NAD(P)H-hydrate dehydratase n=1 Tax=Apilactobacillus xinyiensis TaxID=2841032 RepID=A0ABT0I0B2_9LACO|nr:NAD(P)H-hydrate dehydratase [Apilactobacillus xinyiensis]MCK8624274.1 NAD(P)H-hydrate dehydratase [Apilactobacillus xinyiensis]MCL0318492.1 NAD(P)H-hydrate dehydratase [Apilactobacillus xinyiensis]